MTLRKMAIQGHAKADFHGNRTSLLRRLTADAVSEHAIAPQHVRSPGPRLQGVLQHLLGSVLVNNVDMLSLMGIP